MSISRELTDYFEDLESNIAEVKEDIEELEERLINLEESIILIVSLIYDKIPEKSKKQRMKTTIRAVIENFCRDRSAYYIDNELEYSINLINEEE